MSALTDLFQSMANKIRSKTGTATTYTPPQMVSDGIDDVFDAGVASATTPITPSNSSPVAMAANTGYKPTANGKAVETITDVTPSYVPTSVSADDIVHIGGTGKIVSGIDDLSPSNSSPVALIGTYSYKVDGTRHATEGYAIKSYSSITPSNSSPADITSGGIYQATASGKAVASVTAKTPSDTSPASVTSGSIIKPSSNGYLYKTQQTKSITLIGSITISDTNGHNVALTKAVKDYRYIMVCFGSSVATDKVYGNSTGGGCAAVVFFDTNKWASGFSAEGAFTVGSGNSQSSKTDKIAYYSGSVMTITHSHANSRTDNIYGIN